MDIHGYGTFLEEKAKRRVRQRQKRSSLDTRKWMSTIEDDALLSQLSLPGTHDSAAHGSIWPYVSTQTMDMLQQLNAGIRYFDLRCGLRNNTLQMVHGRALLGQSLEALLTVMYDWLDKHSSEGLIVQIKQDRAEEDSTISFPAAVWATLDSQPQYWRTFPTTPTLGELRGRIQLFRRFHGPPYRGIDVARWQDNPSQPFTIHTWAGLSITIQDHYRPADPEPLPDFVTNKGSDVSGMLKCAATDPEPSRWYVNFASAYQFNLYYQITPRQVAMGGYWDFTWVVGINPRLAQYIKTHSTNRSSRDGRLSMSTEKRKCRVRYGIVAMDFPEQVPDLIPAIIATNFPDKKKRKNSLAVHLMALSLSLVFVAGVLLVGIHGPVDRLRCPPFLHACYPREDTRAGT